MDMRKWWPWFAIGGTALFLSIVYPMYFSWWDHRSCHDSGGQWSAARNACIEPRNADIPNTSGSKTYEDDNQARP